MKEKRNSSFPLPLTFGGVAEFAHASRGRLFAFQVLVALFASVTVACFFEVAWVPPINRTIQALPTRGAIQNGKLNWNGPAVHPLGNSFLWITIDPDDLAEANDAADLQFEFGRYDLRVRSFFGYLALPYPEGFVIGLNRTQIEPWWGAWHPAVTAGIGAGLFVQLFVLWALLALIYAWPVRLIAFYADRQVTIAGAWRLAAAALLPGALFLTLAILAYAYHHLNLVQLLAATVLHLMIGVVYVLFAPFCLPRQAAAGTDVASANPFGNAGTKPDNPFTKGSKGT